VGFPTNLKGVTRNFPHKGTKTQRKENKNKI